MRPDAKNANKRKLNKKKLNKRHGRRLMRPARALYIPHSINFIHGGYFELYATPGGILCEAPPAGR